MGNKVSVVIVSFNTKKLTLQCVDSVIKNGSGCVREIIIVENGSTDGSLVALQKKKDVKIIKNKQNLGFSRANNQAFDVAKGNYVLLLNSDTLLQKGALDELLKVAQMHKKVGAVVPRLFNTDGTVQESVFRLPTITGAILQHWFGKKGLLDKYYPKSEKPSTVESAVMAAFLITPAALDKVGKLDERYFMYYEDLDYCRRIAQAGLSVIYTPKAEVIHHHGESGKYVAKLKDQWRRLVPSSKIYHGVLGYYVFNFVIRTKQLFDKLKK